MKQFIRWLILMVCLACFGTLSMAECPVPEDVCTLYHGDTATVTGYCGYAECFGMSYGENVRVVAADELGLYPRAFKMWHQYEADFDFGQSLWPCNLTQKKTKTEIWIPEEHQPPVCYFSRITNDSTYHEHFASNPLTECLGWLECKE